MRARTEPKLVGYWSPKLMLMLVTVPIWWPIMWMCEIMVTSPISNDKDGFEWKWQNWTNYYSGAVHRSFKVQAKLKVHYSFLPCINWRLGCFKSLIFICYSTWITYLILCFLRLGTLCHIMLWYFMLCQGTQWSKQRRHIMASGGLSHEQRMS